MAVPAARDDESMPTVSGGQHWPTFWHPADATPEGRNHGAASLVTNMPPRPAAPTTSNDQVAID
jgi:hypothetical protein